MLAIDLGTLVGPANAGFGRGPRRPQRVQIPRRSRWVREASGSSDRLLAAAATLTRLKGESARGAALGWRRGTQV